MEFIINVSSQQLKEINAPGELIKINVDLSKVWADVQHYDFLYIVVCLQIPLKDVISVVTEVVYREAFKVAQIQDQKIPLQFDYLPMSKAPISAQIQLLGYDVIEGGVQNG